MTENDPNNARIRWHDLTKQDWKDFPTLPGLHLSFRRTGWRSCALIAGDATVWASCRRGYFTSPRAEIKARGHTYVWRQVGERRDLVRDLVDATSGTPILRITGRHTYLHDRTRVDLSDHTTLVLPVRGTENDTAVMSAVDQSKNVHIRYRISRRLLFTLMDIEVVVSPGAQSLPGIEVVIAVTASCLPRYLAKPGGGA